VQPATILSELTELAREAGLEVRTLRPGEVDTEAASGSAICRVRGAVWVMLAPGDPLEERIAVLARALRENAGEVFEGRYLPPALRELLLPGDAPA
jgi:hypothetical protein